MKRIGLISATLPDDKNTGMLTVDFAAARFLRRFRDVEINWYSFPPYGKRGVNVFRTASAEAINFRYLPESLDELHRDDAIIYWGDFINSRTWLHKSGPIQLKGAAHDERETREILYRCMLMAEAPPAVLKKTVLFGGTIISDREQDNQDPVYHAAFSRLVKGCAQVWMRDPLSASRISLLREDRCDHWGVDPAFLLPSDFGLEETGWFAREAPTIGVFMGARSAVSKEVLSFVRHLARRSGKKVVWIPWLQHQNSARPRRLLELRMRLKRMLRTRSRISERAFLADQDSDRMVSKLKQTYALTGQPGLGDFIRALEQLDFVVTDTYHLCVNSWRLGTPAICLGTPQPRGRNANDTLTDLKKLILFLSYQAGDFYRTEDCLGSPRAVESVLDLIESSQPAAIAERIRTHARSVERQLEACLGELLAP